MLYLSVLSQPTHVCLSPASAKKGTYVQRWQELISNFLHNDCIISNGSGNLAYITEAAGGCRSAWQLSSPEASVTEIREQRENEREMHSVFPLLLLSITNWPCPLVNSRFLLFFDRNKSAFLFLLKYAMCVCGQGCCLYNVLFGLLKCISSWNINWKVDSFLFKGESLNGLIKGKGARLLLCLLID